MKIKTLKILSLHIENFRCFEDFSVDFQSSRSFPALSVEKKVEKMGGITVFIAKNGEGKTTVLNAIDIGLGTFIGKMPKSKGKTFSFHDGMMELDEKGKIVQNKKPKIELEIQINKGKPVTISRTLSNSTERPLTTSHDARVLTDFAKEILAICDEWDEETILPIIAHYGDNRFYSSPIRLNIHIDNISKFNRKYAYCYSMCPNTGYGRSLKWFIMLQKTIREIKKQLEEVQQEHNQDKEKLLQADLKRLNSFDITIRNALEKALEISGWSSAIFNDVANELYVEKKIFTTKELLTKVPISCLSAGTHAVLNIVSDLAYRCCVLNPGKHIPATTYTPGIVMIDEIELHLHPDWQQKVIPVLQEIFPKIQFIVSTHSPQVVSSVPRESVRVIDETGSSYPKSPTQGVDVGNILSEIFSTSPIPQNTEIASKLNQLHAMVAEGLGNTKEWEELYEKLSEYYGKDYPPLLGAKEHRDFLNRINSGDFNA